MDIVIVGGPHSGVGKTLAAEVALNELRGAGYGAIKLTVADGERDPHDHDSSALILAHEVGICGRGASCGVCETVSSKVPSRVITSHAAIHKVDTDTWRLSNAGAVAVAWVISLRNAAPQAVENALAHLQGHGARGAVIEGTTALEWLQPRAAVMVATNPGKLWKEVARKYVGICDVVLHNRVLVAPGDMPTPPEFFAASPVDCDLACATDPGTAWFRLRLRELCGLSAPQQSVASAPEAVR